MSPSLSTSYDPAAASLRGVPVFDVVAALLREEVRERYRVLRMEERVALLKSAKGRTVAVLALPPPPGRTVEQIIDDILADNSRAGTDLIFIGGDPSVSARIEQAVPPLLMNPLQVFHIEQGGVLRGFPQARAEKSARFDTLKKVRALKEQDRVSLFERLEGQQREDEHEQKERTIFFKRMRVRPPRVTYALLGAIGLMFLLQSYFQLAGGDETELFVRMGALHHSLVAEGDWYRVISVGFLHANLMHLGMNGFVLYLLGGQMERVLGSARFLILYTLSLLGASYASMRFGGGALSVGASGAIWGLLGGQVSLAYRRPALLPRSLAEALRPRAKMNIILNLGISMLPFIDAAAHIGGGIAGTLVLWSGVLYPSMAKRAEASEGSPFPEDSARMSAILRFFAGVCVLLLVYGVLLALLRGEPWNLRG